MAARKKPKPTRADREKKEKGLNANQEALCRYYTQNDNTFGNGTRAYAAAYGYDLDDLSEEVEYDPDTGKKIDDSEYDKTCHVWATEALRLLRKPEIQVNFLLNELLKDEIVDVELVKVIKQSNDLAPEDPPHLRDALAAAGRKRPAGDALHHQRPAWRREI